VTAAVSLLRRAQAFLLQPREAVVASPAAGGPTGAASGPQNIEVVVLALSPGSGSTTVASGLVACLRRLNRSAHLVQAVDADAVLPFPPRFAGATTARVWDIGCAASVSYRDLARGADAVVLVAPGTAAPALAELVTRTLAERLGPILLVANRVRPEERWRRRACVCLPESRLGAALARRGLPSGGLGAGLSRLAAIVEGGEP
jgi:hypothetical protein